MPALPEQLATLVDEMAHSGEWKHECKLRGWQDLHLPPAEFASLLRTEVVSIEGVLRQLVLVS